MSIRIEVPTLRILRRLIREGRIGCCESAGWSSEEAGSEVVKIGLRIPFLAGKAGAEPVGGGLVAVDGGAGGGGEGFAEERVVVGAGLGSGGVEGEAGGAEVVLEKIGGARGGGSLGQ